MKIMGSTAPAGTELTSVPDDVGHTSWSQRVRSLLLGPHGGGTTRRRASDAVRVGIAAVLVVICVPLVQANTSVEIHVTELITPPPSGIHWLITALWFLGSVGVIVTLVLVGLLVPRLAAVRQMARGRAWPRCSSASCSMRCSAPRPGARPFRTSPASTRASRSSSWPWRRRSRWRACRT